MGTLRLFAAGVFFSVALTCAQPAPSLTFEVASVKAMPPNSTCANGSMIAPMPGGGLRIECVALQPILNWAYQVQDFQISGGPAWVKSVSWNIDAKAPRSEPSAGEPLEYEKMNDSQRQHTMADTRARVQALLADRFQLAIHRETRDMSSFILTVAKNGSKLKESATNTGFLKRGRGQIVGKGAQIATLANFLGIDLRAPVTDRTGLTGHYDFQLDWTPDSPASAENPSTAPANAGPSIFTAIQEQLGLHLEAHKAPGEMLVIDGVEKPAEN